MTKDQVIVYEWLNSTGNDFLTDIVELEGAYESVPDDVHEAFVRLDREEKIEVVRDTAINLLL